MVVACGGLDGCPLTMSLYEKIIIFSLLLNSVASGLVALHRWLFAHSGDAKRLDDLEKRFERADQIWSVKHSENMVRMNGIELDLREIQAVLNIHGHGIGHRRLAEN